MNNNKFINENLIYHLENTTSKLHATNIGLQNLNFSEHQHYYPKQEDTSSVYQNVSSKQYIQNTNQYLKQYITQNVLPPNKVLQPKKVDNGTNIPIQENHKHDLVPQSETDVDNKENKKPPPIERVNLNKPPQLVRTQSGLKRKKNCETRVKVVVRIRPPIPEDSPFGLQGPIEPCTFIGEDKKQLILKRQAYDEREFSFDNVLSPTSTQEEMYECVGRQIVNDVLQGYNGTILAYGQTGTGKTYTIFGPNLNWDLEGNRKPKPLQYDENGEWIPDEMSGVIPKAVYQIFKHISENKDSIEFRVTVSFLQIYMENTMDLLDTSKTNLNIREDPKLGIFVENLSQVVVKEPSDVMELIRDGAQNRVFSCTNMNKVSSRSHVILILTIEQRAYEVDEEYKKERGVKRGVLTIVDLAGSERVSKSGSEGQRLEEAKKINRSLSALGNCVAALIDGHSVHIPFRDSKLTRLLTDSLGGNAKTCLIATIGPALWNYDETYSTLLFATRAMAVKNHAVINEVVDFKTLSGNLQRKISLIENEKFRLMARNVDLEREVSSLRKELLEIKQNPNAVTTITAPPNMTKWEERERELVAKFTNIIHHLQVEIAKQNMMYLNHLQQNDGDAIIEQLVTGMLAIPVVRQKLIAKLSAELGLKSPPKPQQTQENLATKVIPGNPTSPKIQTNQVPNTVVNTTSPKSENVN